MCYGTLIDEGIRSCSQNEQGEIVAAFSFSPDSRVFAGHFPGNPILPGVYQLEALKRIIERVLNCSCRLKKVGSIKFFQPILPDQEFIFVVKCNRDNPAMIEVKCHGSIGADKVKCTEIKASYEINGTT